MAKIKTYVTDYNPSINDKVIGTETNNLGKTKNYKIGTLLGLIENSANISYNYDYTFSIDDLATETVGVFNTYNNQTDFNLITQLIFNKTNNNTVDLTPFFTVLANNTDKVIIKISDGTNVNFAYFVVTTNSTNNDAFVFDVELIGSIESGSLVNASDYKIAFDIHNYVNNTSQLINDGQDGIHPFITTDRKGVAYGVVPLGGDVKIDSQYLSNKAITIIVKALESSKTAFVANHANYEFEIGDVIKITYNSGNIKHFMYDGGAKSNTTSYSEINASQIDWPNVTSKPALITNLQNELNARNNRPISDAVDLDDSNTSGSSKAVKRVYDKEIINEQDITALQTSKENSFIKKTAFNKNFGTTSGTVAQGNDARIENGQSAYNWGNHASEGYLTSLPSHNHDSMYYPKSYINSNFLGKTATAADSSKLGGVLPANYQKIYNHTITVNGSSSRFYLVKIPMSRPEGRFINIYRDYADTAPQNDANWNDTTTHLGALSIQGFFNGNQWGGSTGSLRYSLAQRYTKQVARIQDGQGADNNYLYVYLRGGGAQYKIDIDTSSSVQIDLTDYITNIDSELDFVNKTSVITPHYITATGVNVKKWSIQQNSNNELEFRYNGALKVKIETSGNIIAG